MNIRWLDKREEFEAIGKEWDNTLLLSKQDNPFLLSGFLLTWWKYYSGNLKLRILVFYQNDKIVGGLPLCQYKNGYLEYR